MNEERSREVLLAAPAAILTILIAAVIAVVATENSGSSSRVVAIKVEGNAPAHSKPSRVAPSTTTTGSTTTTTVPIVTTTTTGTAAPAASTPATTAPPTAGAPYTAPPLPRGTSATITQCTWSGGQLRASGTVTNNTGEDDSFFVTSVWVSQGLELDEDFDLFDVASGQTLPWSLQTEGDRPTAPFSCAVEVE